MILPFSKIDGAELCTWLPFNHADALQSAACIQAVFACPPYLQKGLLSQPV